MPSNVQTEAGLEPERVPSSEAGHSNVSKVGAQESLGHLTGFVRRDGDLDPVLSSVPGVKQPIRVN